MQDVLNRLARLKYYHEHGDYLDFMSEIDSFIERAREEQKAEQEDYKDFIRKTEPKSRLLSDKEWSNDDEMERMKFKYGNLSEEMEPTVR